MIFEARCTAVLVPGTITQRVDRVIRPRREARDLIAAAQRNVIVADPSPRIAPPVAVVPGPMVTVRRRPRSRSGQPRRPGRKFKIVSISVYDEDLAAIDAAVDRLRAEGHRHMFRSKLLRIAFSLLDIEQLAKAGML